MSECKMTSKNLLTEIVLEEEEDDDIILYYLYGKRRRKISSVYRCRRTEGFFSMLISNHLSEDEEKFRHFFRLNQSQFNYILSLVENNIKTRGGSITPQEKLSITLRFMATGESYASLSFAYRVSACNISVIVKEVLKHLKKALLPIFMPAPTEKDFKRIAEEFWNKWNFPNCTGAIDGKHVRIKAPGNSGSLFFNYKGFFSIVLLAIVDANYSFIAVDVGAYGREGDSAIFRKSTMGKKIITRNFNFPEPRNLPGTNTKLNHFLIGDEAFALDSYMMKPYPRNIAKNDTTKAIFNYRLCRARRVSENAFGLLSQVFRISIAILPETCVDLILVTCCLHNLLRGGYLENSRQSVYQFNAEETTPQNMRRLNRAGGFRNRIGFEIRDQLRDFLNSNTGAVSWQENRINRMN